MTRRTQWLTFALLAILLLCASLSVMAGRYFASFPEILLGQIHLSSQTKPVLPRNYLSAEFLLNQVALSEIEQAVYIDLQEDVLFWDPYYVGFARTELSRDEIRDLLQTLSTGALFYQTTDGSSYQCVTRKITGKPGLESCTEGERYMEQYTSVQWDASQNKTIGVLLVHLTGGRRAEIRIYRSGQGLAYDPLEKTGDWWFKGITGASSLIEKMSTRATLASIPVLWPHLSADEANSRAARIIGDRYQPALALIRSSPAVGDVFGEIHEIRPAMGINEYASWMDSTSIFLTTRVIGSRGEGAVIIQGYDCFDLQMVFQGIPLDDGSSYICP